MTIRRLVTSLATLAVLAGGVASVALAPGVPHGWQKTTGDANWSGYAAVRGDYTQVSAGFQVPRLNCAGVITSYAAFWAGLDGFTSKTVEQTGVSAQCWYGTAYYAGFWEMYPAYPGYFTATVRAGDEMYASVSYSNGNYTLVLRDITRGWTRTVTRRGSGKNSSAEVITEAPASSALTILPLADFSEVLYANIQVNSQPLTYFDRYRIVIDQRGQNDKTSNLSNNSFWNED